MWASPPTDEQRGCGGSTSLPPSTLRVDTSLAEGGEGFPRLRARGTDSHASDIGHWLGMTPLRGIRGDAPQGYLLRCVGIAPYEMPIEVRSVKRREGQSPSPTDVFTIVPLYRASPLFAYSSGDFVHSMGNCTRVRSSSVRRAAAAPSSSVQVMVSPDRA